MDRSRDQSVASSFQKDDATPKLKQGSILPRAVRDQLGLPTLKDNPDPVVIVISHDCDLVKPQELEPLVELICGKNIDEMKFGFANAKSPRVLHIEYQQGGEKKVLELSALNKILVDKWKLINTDVDPDAICAPGVIKTLQAWLAARYNRAAFPDGLDLRLEPIKKKLSSADPKAIRGTWMRYEPKDNHLPDEAPYELWVKVVYSTEEYDAKATAERHADELRLSFEKRFFNKDKGLWQTVDLHVCEAVADTVFSVWDMLPSAGGYEQWRLEHLSLKQDPPGEYI
jgi:hypothetical protein